MQTFQRFAGCDAAYFSYMSHLGCAQSIEAQCRETLCKSAEQLLVVVDTERRMQTALQQQLVATESEHLLDFGNVLLKCGYEVSLGLVGFAVEVAKTTPRNTDIGNVDIAVNLPRHDRRVIDTLTAQAIGYRCQFGQRSIPERKSLLSRQSLTIESLIEDVV